jgi:hypothetical protein
MLRQRYWPWRQTKARTSKFGSPRVLTSFQINREFLRTKYSHLYVSLGIKSSLMFTKKDFSSLKSFYFRQSSIKYVLNLKCILIFNKWHPYQLIDFYGRKHLCHHLTYDFMIEHVPRGSSLFD